MNFKYSQLFAYNNVLHRNGISSIGVVEKGLLNDGDTHSHGNKKKKLLHCITKFG